MSSETDKELNPSVGEVIRFVANNGQLLDEVADAQFKLLINVGKEDGIQIGQRVLIFALGPNLTDPKTGRNLGCFEVVRGEGKVRSMQTRMAVVESTETRSELRPKKVNALNALAMAVQAEHEWVHVPAPFKNPSLGDQVRLI